LGHTFFEEERTVTVTSHRYVEMLCNFLEPRLNKLGNASLWFQQDGATAHTARASTEVQREIFPGCLISLCGDSLWLARSPDLSACDFFLLGYLKAEVFKCRAQTTDELKNAIRHKITAIPEVMTRRALHNFWVGLQ
jgi:hypothetical protein